MNPNLKSIKKRLDEHAVQANAISFSKLLAEVRGFEAELREISKYEETSNKPWITPMELIKEILGE